MRRLAIVLAVLGLTLGASAPASADPFCVDIVVPGNPPTTITVCTP